MTACMRILHRAQQCVQNAGKGCKDLACTYVWSWGCCSTVPVGLGEVAAVLQAGRWRALILNDVSEAVKAQLACFQHNVAPSAMGFSLRCHLCFAKLYVASDYRLGMCDDNLSASTP